MQLLSIEDIGWSEQPGCSRRRVSEGSHSWKEESGERAEVPDVHVCSLP
jgi:hypothetical protein